ncbi:squamosa promoter-binding-like protein 14 [Dorcoceras hygrometricum]|uniref:Squamosa promoter-binding-like protein 14 n=1 Tax=Dorcoceras hygrometricum TaxID=472368 RepID=A0A2Z7AWK1_9LAMI|nr:squamosa promoter-binding-like protein 14 [Dorcoceras hygrometricum]
MEDAGAQVATPVVIPQPHAGIFYNVHPVAKKRGPPFNPINFVHQNPSENWNPLSWDWDSTSFVAKQLHSDGIFVGSDPHIQQDLPRSMEVQNNNVQNAKNPDRNGEDDENLSLKLGAGDGVGPSGSTGAMDVVEPQAVSRPNKRVRAGSPGGASYPRCQVDNCKEDLSTAKDYHRRHKVCEVHSKASKALVGKQMQRFCQQCSRFHPLSEFDEGKRSCRRRLAGHNRRRRKTQPDDSTQRLLVPDNRNNNMNCDLDIVSLLAVLARAQGNIEDQNGKFSQVPDKDQLIQILNKINSLPLPADAATKLPVEKSSNGSVHNLPSSENQNRVIANAPSPSTLDLLAVLSATSGAPSSDAFEIQSQPSTEESGSEKSKSPCVDQAVSIDLQRGSIVEVPTMGERSGTTYHYPTEDVDCLVQETPSLPLQLFSSSPEDDSGGKLQSGGKTCFSSGSSNPSEGRSPVSSPPIVHDLFPIHTSKETMKHVNMPSRGNMKASISNNCNTSLQLFGRSVRTNENGSIPNSPYHAGYSSSCGSDHSPSRQLSDVQDRTGRIVFKLFDKDPSHLPGSLRAQIFNWLSSSPSEMESYIRPGCIVLSIYLSMSSFAWEQFEKNLLQYVKSLVRGVDVEFWRNGRFLIHTDRRMASYKDGSIRLCKSWRGWSTPELIWVSPVAVVGGQETSVLLRGKKLTTPGTKIYCTHPDGYNASLVPALLHQDSATDELVLGGLKVNLATPNTLGRCFIEVENNIRGTCFPVIIADDHICQELRLLEPDIVGSAEVHEGVDHNQNRDRPMSREEALHFLNELGWLFQRKHNSTLLMSPEYKLSRLQFLLTFSVERDFCSVVETLLGIVVEYNLGRGNLARESLEMLAESHLLNMAVKRRCRRMVDLLIHYSVFNSTDHSEMFIFVPNMAGPGGVTPLHLAACTSSADDIVDALTSDPKEIGLDCWNSLLDSNGFSPYAYALMRNNNSYNSLVAQKYAKRKMGQVSISIDNEIVPFELEVNKDKSTVSNLYQGGRSCSRCALVAGYSKKFPNSQGLLQPPFIHSLLVVAAVCVCVCVFLRVLPYLSSVAPFAWENLDYGAM